ncbi:MAG: precorrin-6y C5,15-methyltransferase (decarboxylating) subunit CbiE [Dongiaceae bacterium]
MNPWLAVIGMGEDGLRGLSPTARELIERAELLVGGERHLAMVPAGNAERISWSLPLAGTLEQIRGARGQRVAVLATGDTMWFGIGVTLAGAIQAEEMRILPGRSAFSLACGRLGWPLAEVECLTLHGRPLSLMTSFVGPDARLLLLSENGGTPTAVAKLLTELGYGQSRMAVLERMGHRAEGRIDGLASQWTANQTHDFNTIAVECVAGPDAVIRARVPGLPDEAFRHDGQLTKREVRAATLAKLMPLPGQLLWDVGAGCGSIGIEWLRCGRAMGAIAIERAAERRAMIAENIAALGAPNLEIVQGEAPRALAQLPAPDAIFIGGGLTGDGVVELCWRALKPGGRLVANAVTIEGEARLIALRGQHGGSLTRIAISQAEAIGPFSGWRPAMAVTQYAAIKP